jgi:hypothetical protein
MSTLETAVSLVHCHRGKIPFGRGGRAGQSSIEGV